MAACAAIDALERALPPTRAALALFRASEPTLTFFKRWNVAAYFALRRREIVTRLDAELEEDRLTRAVAGVEDGDGTALSRAPPGAAFATAAAAGTYAALEKCFDAERVFLPRAADKFVKLAAQILARFGGWVVAGATSVAPAAPSVGAGREAPLAEAYDSASSGQADRERPGESGSLSLESLPPQEKNTPSVVSWGATASDEDLLRLRGDVEVLAARVETSARAARRGGARADARRRGGGGGDGGFVRRRGGVDARARFGRVAGRIFYKNERERSKRRRVARRAAGVGRRAALRRRARAAQGRDGDVPHDQQADADEAVALRERRGRAPAPLRRERRGARGVRADAARARGRRRRGRLRRVRKSGGGPHRLGAQDGSLADPAQGQEGGEGKGIRRGDFGNRLDGAGNQGGPTDAEKICRQVRLDAEAFGRAVARLGFDPEKSDAFAKLWEVCGEGDAFSSA